MSSRLKLILALAFALVVGGGFVFYAWYTGRDDADLVAALPDTPTTAAVTSGTGASTTNVTSGTAAPTTTLPGTDGLWELQPGDRETFFVGYQVEETLRGLDVPATGTTGQYVGSMVADGASIRELTITVDMTTIESDEDRRDRRMRSDGLETEEFPTATFTLSEPITLAGAPEIGVPVDATVTGSLELHGVTNPVTIPVQARWNGDTVDVTGEIPIELRDYGINPPQFSFVSVRDTGKVVFVFRFARG